MKPLKNLNSQPLPKKQSFFKNQLVTIYLLACVIGTYLDLYFVGKGFYSFPSRLFPDTFNINIVFTLGILPLFTFLLILAMKKMSPFTRWSFILVTSIIIAFIEVISERFGVFIHTEQWKHYYSLIGYFIYIVFMWNFYKWQEKVSG